MARILIVEDVPAVLFSLTIVLEGDGHQITGAESGARGLEFTKTAAFDLVVTDIWMPGLSGTDVIREVKARSPRTRFLAITGGDPNGNGSHDALRQRDFGADLVLLKPFEKHEFLNAVSSLLELPLVDAYCHPIVNRTDERIL